MAGQAPRAGRAPSGAGLPARDESPAARFASGVGVRRVTGVRGVPVPVAGGKAGQMRTTRALLLGLCLALPAAVRAGVGGPAGTWKVTLLESEQRKTVWLLKIEAKDGKLTGKVIAAENKQ